LILDGVIPADIDDTLFHHSGHKINGAGSWQDAVHSTATTVAHAWGLNPVVLTLRIYPPWGGVGLPATILQKTFEIMQNISSSRDLASPAIGIIILCGL
jgi:hypothetical protein